MRHFLVLRPNDAALLKATVKKLVMVAGYTTKDGRVVPPHQKAVHYNPEVSHVAVASGQGSHSQKKAHAQLSGKAWWQGLSLEDKAAAVMSLATDLQDKDSKSAAVSMWKTAALSGKNPTAAQWAAFNVLPTDKKAALLDAVKAKAGLGHLKAPALAVPPGQATKPGAQSFGPGDSFTFNSQFEKLNAGTWEVYNVSEDGALVFLRKKGAKAINKGTAATITSDVLAQAIAIGTAHPSAQSLPDAPVAPYPHIPTPEELAAMPGAAQAPSTSAPASHQDAAAALTKMESGPHYQKIAIAKLKQDKAWLALPPSAQHEQAMALYKQLQGAASQAAAVSMAKKAMLAGKVPSKAQYLALVASGEAVMDKVEQAVGSAQYHDLMGKAANGAGDAGKAAVKQLVQQNIAKLGGAKDLTMHSLATAAFALAAKKASVVQAVEALGFGAKNSTMHGALLLTPYPGSMPYSFATELAAVTFANNAQKAGIDVQVVGGSPFLIAVYGAKSPAGMSPDDALAAGIAANAAKSSVQKSSLGSGPKDGDTKPGADGGTLVFKNGRWHKQGDEAPSLADAIDAVPMPSLADFKSPSLVQGALELLKDKIKSDGISALSGTTKQMSSTGKLITMLPDPSNPNGFFKITGSVGANTTHAKLYEYVQALKDAAKSAGKAKAPAAKLKAAKVGATAQVKPEAVAHGAAASTGGPTGMPIHGASIVGTPDKPMPMDGWKQVGAPQGSNPGGKFRDAKGGEWYVKFPANADIAKNEFLADKLYEMLGVSGPKSSVVVKDGKIGVAHKWVSLKKQGAGALASLDGTRAAFPIDAWLANWDVVGQAYDNLQAGPDGKAHRVDAGGALLYRAQGEPKGKAFGHEVAELESLTNADKNPQSAAVFGGIQAADMQWGLAQLAKLKPSQIDALVGDIGPGTPKERQKLAGTLVARRTFILQKFGIADPWNKPPVDESKVAGADPAKLPPAIDFNNIDGKPLSSKKHVNNQNTKDSKALAAFAATGNLTALKDYQYDAVDKETGADAGKKPIEQHPAKMIVTQWVDSVQALQSVAYPYQESLNFPPMSAGASDDISRQAGHFHPADTTSSVKPEYGWGFFMHVGSFGQEAADACLSGIKPFFASNADPVIGAVKSAYDKLTQPVKSFIGKVQSNGVINHIWSKGQTSSGIAGLSKQELAKTLYDEAMDMPGGMSIWRWMADSSGETVKALLSAKPGDVMQNTDAMCCSRKKAWGNQAHFGSAIRLKITAAPGAKSLPTFGSGSFSGEAELTTLPGARFVVAKVEKGVPGNAAGVSVELVMLPPDTAYLATLAQEAALKKSLPRGTPWLIVNRKNYPLPLPHPSRLARLATATP